MLPVNPPSQRLGFENAVLTGRGSRYHVPDFEGCLSIKTVLDGAAVWETENRRFLLGERKWLVLNDRQRYTITIDSAQPATTFCLFFERGFVEDIHRGLVTRPQTLLDMPQPCQTSNVEFMARIEPSDARLMGFLRRFHTEVSQGTMSRIEWDERFLHAGKMLVETRAQYLHEMAGIPAVRHATREEVYRRLLQGRDFILSSLHEPIRLNDIASAAFLSPFHFHRTFTSAFRETPHQYLTRHRLQRAAELLQRRQLSVTQVAFTCGFESLTSFSDLFRRRFGIPPGKFSKIQEAKPFPGL